MTVLRIAESTSVQFTMIKHAEGVGWTVVLPEDAVEKRGGLANMLFRDELRSKLLQFNHWLSSEDARSIIETIEANPANIDGNREVLAWIRGERGWYDENEKRHRSVKIIDFDQPSQNTLNVSWEWLLKPPGRKSNRADVIFLVNGIPVCIVEHKNPKDGGAIERAIKQLRRYEIETPELVAAPQLFNVTHMLDYWYGVTWNVTRRDLVRWKQTPQETYRCAVQSFFEPSDFLRTLEQWILFYVQDGETKKSVLRQHQTRAINAVIARCAAKDKKRGLIWHTQGSGKTFTLLTAARLVLQQKERFHNATVILVVDRTELEGQLKGWIERLLGEMQREDIACARAESKAQLQELFDADFRGLIISMIHKFSAVRKDSCMRDNVFVFIDEAHRSVAKDLGTYLMAALPNATIIGFTGTPIAKTAQGEGTFKIFGAEDANGYLDKYSIKESIEDETTVPIKHVMASSELMVPVERLDKEFFELAATEGVTDIHELNKALDRAVGLRTFLKADERVDAVSHVIAEHFITNVHPLGYKAFVVAVDREACAKYKRALSKLLPAGWVEAVYTESASDAVERPLVAEHQLSPAREDEVRTLFKQPDTNPRILIVTDKLLTGYDAPVLYCLYLDKPMRNHVLLQAIARVNRPYEDNASVRKRIGLVIDFVGVLRELEKALQFDSKDVSGVIEGIEVLLRDFVVRIAAAKEKYLGEIEGGAGADEQLESVVYGMLLEPDARKDFFETYKSIESLWEILSPSAELRDHIETFQSLAGLYAAARNAYAESVGFVADLAYKTKKLVEQSATVGSVVLNARSVTFNVETLEALRRESGPDEGKVFNLVRGLQEEINDTPDAGPILRPLKDRAEQILRDLERRTVSGAAAMDVLAALAAERDASAVAAANSGLSPKGFAISWQLRDDRALKGEVLLR